MPQVQYAGIRAAGSNVRLEALADGETSSQILMRILGHDEVRCIFGQHASCELFGLHVVLLYCFWVLKLFHGCSHERRPLAAEVDEILRGWLALAAVGAQQFMWCTAVGNVPPLPRDVETIPYGKVHSLFS